MIELSQKAATMIDQLIAQQEDSNLFLRIGIEDGGCSGLSYLIHLDDTRNEYDHYLEHDGITVAWDSRAEQYIEELRSIIWSKVCLTDLQLITLMLKQHVVVELVLEQQPIKELVINVINCPFHMLLLYQAEMHLMMLTTSLTQ